MRSLRGAAARLCLLAGLVAAAPPPPHSTGIGGGQPGTACTRHAVTSSETSVAPSLVPSSTGGGDCAAGARCDCSRIEDKNSDEFFQRVTDPVCELCRVGTPTLTAATTSQRNSLPVSDAMSDLTTDYRTVTPGTYTITASDVVSVIIVPEPSEAPPPPPASSSAGSPSSASPRVVTIVETTVVTLGVSSAPTTTALSTASSAGDATTTTSSPDGSGCAAFCDCSRIQDKKSDEYYQCLTNPACEHCWATSSPSTTTSGAAASTSRPAPLPRSSATGAGSGSSSSASTAASPAPPKPSCPDYCECARIIDKKSNEFFQCITSPDCERCRAGGG